MCLSNSSQEESHCVSGFCSQWLDKGEGAEIISGPYETERWIVTTGTWQLQQARGLRQRPQAGTGCVCLCLASLGTAGSLIMSFVEMT